MRVWQPGSHLMVDRGPFDRKSRQYLWVAAAS